MTTNLRIARAYSVLVAASVFAHSLSLVKEIISAKYFGVSHQLDSFYAALTFPTLVNSVLTSPFAVIFLPLIAGYRQTGSAGAKRAVNAFATASLTALLAISLLTALLPAPVVSLFSPGLSESAGAYAASVLRALSAGIVFSGAVAMLTGAVNAYEHFLWPAVTGTFMTAGAIVSIVLFADTYGAISMAWGMVAGTALQALVLTPLPRRLGFRFSPETDFSSGEFRSAWTAAASFMAVMLVANLSLASNRFLASWLPEGSIAALAYADKLVQVPLVIFSGAIASAVYPFLSAQAAGGRTEEIKETISLSLRMSALIFIPVAAGLALLSKPAVRLLFQRGAFGQEATALTAAILSSYSLLLLSNYVNVILMRVLLAFGDYRSVFKVTVMCLLLGVAANLALMNIVSPGACGIALGTSAVSMLSAGVYFAIVSRRLGGLGGAGILKNIARIAAAAALSSPAAVLAHKAAEALLPSSVPGQAASLLAAAAAGTAVFAALAALFRLEEWAKLIQLYRTRFGTRHHGQGAALSSAADISPRP